MRRLACGTLLLGLIGCSATPSSTGHRYHIVFSITETPPRVGEVTRRQREFWLDARSDRMREVISSTQTSTTSQRTGQSVRFSDGHRLYTMKDDHTAVVQDLPASGPRPWNVVLNAAVDRPGGMEPVAGQTCVVYFRDHGDDHQKTWMWKDSLALKTVKVDARGEWVEEATRVDTDATLPDDLFTVPAGVTTMTASQWAERNRAGAAGVPVH